MNQNQQAIPAGDERLAGGLAGIVQQLQKNRRQGVNGMPAAPQGSPQEGAQILEAIRNKQQNEQEQNATGAPGALQKERGQEGGRQRDVRQGEAEGGIGQGSQVQRTEEEEQQLRRRMM